MKRLLLLSLVSFAISFANGQALQLQHPAKGDVWAAFTYGRIQWQFANVDNIKIELSSDSGRTWSILQSSYPASAAYYDWTVSNKPSDSCFVRISDASNSAVQSSSYPNNPFIIPKPTLRLDPVGASVYSKTVMPISWTSSGTQTVTLWASFDNSVSYNIIADNISASQGFYNWRVNDVIAERSLIVIQSTDNTSVTDTIKQSFSISKLPVGAAMKYRGGSYDGHSSASNKAKGITLLSPNKGEQLTANTTFPINWSSNDINQISIKFSSDSGATWTNIASNLPGSSSNYIWSVPSTAYNKCLIQVVDETDATYFDVSDAVFSINSGTIKFTGPISNEIAYKGQAMPISWSSTGIGKVKISYFDDQAWKTVSDGVNAKNEVVNWTVPFNVSDSIKLRISDYDNPSLIDTISKVIIKSSPSISAIKYRGGSYDGHSSATNKAAFITLTQPKANTGLASAVKYNIAWASTAVAKVDIAFSSDSGHTWQNLVTAYPNSQSYEWTVPAITSTKCLIRVQSADDASINDISVSVFTILPEYLDLIVDTVTTHYFGTAIPLEWTQQGIDKVSLEYKTAKNGSWQSIKTGINAGLEIYNWVLPTLPKDSLWVRISDYNNSSVKDEQLISGVFKALPAISEVKYHGGSFDGYSFRSTNNKISIFKPGPTDTLRSGSVFPISWVSGNVTDSVTLQYSLDSGATWKTIGNSSAISGQYEWTIPSASGSARSKAIASKTSSNTLFDKCLVRAVMANTSSEIVGISSKTFSMQQSSASGPDYYWVSGSGLWSDYSHHWATTSGGTTFHSQPPSSANNVYFDANSFSLAEQTVTIDAAAYCNDMDWTGVTNKPNLVITPSNKLTVSGSAILNLK